MRMRCLPTLAWCAKVGLGLVLIGHFAVLIGMPEWLAHGQAIPYTVSLALVLLGGLRRWAITSCGRPIGALPMIHPG